MASMIMTSASVLLAALLLLNALPLGGAQDDDGDDAPAVTTTGHVADVMLGDEAVTDDEDMRGRMALLLLSFWDRELQGLDGLGEHPAARRRRDLVFRPLWASRDRHARRQRLRQRYWDELRRSQRIGRAAEPEATETRRQYHQQRPLLHARARRAAVAPLSEDALLEDADGEQQRLLSRVRRQWAFRPLFQSRASQARFRRVRRLRRDADGTDPASDADAMKSLSVATAAAAETRVRARREWASRPLFASRQLGGARGLRRRQREAREAEAPSSAPARRHRDADGTDPAAGADAMKSLSVATAAAAEAGEPRVRARREWASRPLFASRQLGGARGLRRRQQREAREAEAPSSAPARRRREFVDVPLFAVKQIEAERHREEQEITHAHHRGGQQQQQREAHDRELERRLEQAEEALREYRNYREYYRYYG